jgi:hypothetical protein
VKKGYKPDLIEAGDWGKESSLTLDDYTFKSSHKVPPGVRLVGGQSTKWYGRVSPFPRSAYVNRSGLSGHEWPVPYAEIEKSYLEVCKILQIDDQTENKGLVHKCDSCSNSVDKVFFDFLENPNMFQKILRDMIERNEVLLNSSTYCSNLLVVADRVLVTTISSKYGLTQLNRELYDDVFICCGTLDSTRLVLSSFPEIKELTSAGKFLMDHLDGYVGEIKIRPSNLKCIKEFYLDGSRRLPNHVFGLGINKSTKDINWHIEVVPLVRVYLFDPVMRRFCSIPKIIYEMFFLLERLVTFIPNRISRILNNSRNFEVYSLWLRAEEFPNSESILEIRQVLSELSISNLLYKHKVSYDSKKTIQRTIKSFSKSLQNRNLGKIRIFWWLRFPGIFNLGGNNHPMGTLSTGTSDWFPVNQELRLRVAPKVRVISSAIFPSGGHQNPTSLAMSLAIVSTEAFPENSNLD